MSSALSKKEAPTVSYEAMDMSAAGTRRYFPSITSRSLETSVAIIDIFFCILVIDLFKNQFP